MEPNQEITAKQLILNTRNWFAYFLGYWKTICVVGFLGGIIGLSIGFISKKKYIAETTFALEEKGGMLGAYASIASQFGVDLGKNEGGVFAGDNIIELIKSNTILRKTLLTKVDINGTTDYMLNTYLTSYGMQDDLVEKGIEFKPADTNAFNQEQDSVLLQVVTKIKKGQLQVDKIDKKLTIYRVQFKSKHELFSKIFTQQLVQNVSEYYVEIKTQKSRGNVNLLQNRLDSVKTALDAEMYGAAISQDQNQNLARMQASIPMAKKKMNVEILMTMYGELLKNLELAKLMLSKDEPLVQVIDTPILPLRFEKAGKLTSAIIGGILGGFLSLLVLYFKRVYNRIMKEA